ncbi:DUF1330 domain-containing protein [Streptomyces sp. DT224]|uniref:DUF1330 domain-containing protein n=1 Tax=Streptomyces sp. DT224 TaxID=3393426 RepID=UPI003CE9778B
MTAYAIAYLYPEGRPVGEVIDYIERIQSTLDPYGGRFLVHKAPVAVVEGARPGAVVVIGFPSLGEARTWYASPAYRELVPLRARNMAGDVVLVEGVAPDYDPRGTAAALRAEAAATPAA